MRSFGVVSTGHVLGTSSYCCEWRLSGIKAFELAAWRIRAWLKRLFDKGIVYSFDQLALLVGQVGGKLRLVFGGWRRYGIGGSKEYNKERIKVDKYLEWVEDIIQNRGVTSHKTPRVSQIYTRRKNPRHGEDTKAPSCILPVLPDEPSSSAPAPPCRQPG